ncbi:hypothetical protein [unidentified bacterial endosymbiont]|uniref:hypothetical protein n=1 Tax=unidentified bacterial endosymbiont TaxID=2355 RepID=UPI0020A10CF1|nr:hypothetical protein [unidentified bacterial endosymbiont]
MSDIQLFRYSISGVRERSGKAAIIEKPLQNVIELQRELCDTLQFLHFPSTTLYP